ncbi:MAG: MdtA/MuxA family multidrug efflux RND transporter periplasmic adaptor subunit [Magnetospirillum sp.]|nr:MdtA/MuxA family multidrug efflux RND transporter periplasmic adaptor subunit [Magnetospirillum sp.]
MDEHQRNAITMIGDQTKPDSRTLLSGTMPPEAPRRARRSRAWIAVGLIFLAGLGWLALRPHGPQPGHGGRPGANAPVAVGAATAQKGDIPITLDGLGTVTPIATILVRTQIAGQLQKIAFREGQVVQAGDFLAQIDPRPYQAQLEQYQGQLIRDKALLAEGELNLSRYRTLVAQKSIAVQQLDTQQSLVDQYRGAIAMDMAQIDSARVNLIYCHIVAPVTGRVGLRQVDEGNYVQTSDPNGIVVITQMQPITVIFTLPEDNVPAVMRRLHAGATLEVDAWDRDMTTKLATGKLLTVDNQIDTTTGTVKLRAEFPNDDETLFPNQFVNARLVVDVLKDATVIPTAAIQRGAPGTFVYLVTPGGTVTVRPVTLGPTSGERVAVTAGLAPGDRVVVDGADKLREGAKVTLPGSPAHAPR